MLKVIVKNFDTLSNDQLIIKILEQTKLSLPLTFISELSGIPKDRCCRILRSLERYGFVRKKTEQKAVYYSVKKVK